MRKVLLGMGMLLCLTTFQHTQVCFTENFSNSSDQNHTFPDFAISGQNETPDSSKNSWLLDLFPQTAENEALALNFPAKSIQMTYADITGDTTAPAITPDAVFEGPAIWNNEINQTLTWTVTEKNSYTVDLSVSYDNGSSWNLLARDVSDSFDFDVPDSALTYNLLFRITATDAASNKSSYTTSQPITIVDPVQQVTYTTGWQLTGAPFTQVDADNSALADAFRFKWNGTGYESADTYSTGGGHWLGTYHSVHDVLTGTIITNDIAITKHAGWHIISVPLFSRVSVDSMTVQHKPTLNNVSFARAIDSGWITRPYSYNSGVYSVTSELVPFKAYWIGVLADSVEIHFPIHTYAYSPIQKTNKNGIELIVEDGNNEQKLRIGTTVERTIPLPPAAPNTSSSGLVGKSTVLGNLFIELPVSNETESVTSLGTTGPDRTINIVWKNQAVSDDMTYILITSEGNKLDLTKSGTYLWNTANKAPVILSSPLSLSAEATSQEIPFKAQQCGNHTDPFTPIMKIASIGFWG